MKRCLLVVVCIGGFALAGCDSSTTTGSGDSSKYSGTGTVTKPDESAAPIERPGGAQDPGVLLPPGAPPEARATMEKGAGGASNMPKGGAAPGAGGGTPAPPK